MPQDLHLWLVGPSRMAHLAGAFSSIIESRLCSEGMSGLIRVSEIAVLTAAPPTEARPVTDLVIFNTYVPTHVLDRMPNLRRVVKVGPLRDGLDRTHLSQRGISYTKVADAAYVSVAEHTIMLMLACARRLPESLINETRSSPEHWPDAILTDQDRRRTNWMGFPRTSFRTLWKSTLGIVGLGEIGRELALRARGLGMVVTYNNRTRLPGPLEHELDAEWRERADLLRGCDFLAVTATVPSNGQPVLSSADIDLLPKRAIVVNTSRGGAIDEGALISRASSDSGGLGGIGLDVYQVEPSTGEPFRDCPNRVLTAHVAATIPHEERLASAVDWIVSRSRKDDKEEQAAT